MIAILIEATVYTGAGTQVLYYCTGPGVVVNGQFYEPRVSDAGSLRTMMYAEGSTSGRSQTGYGEVKLTNTDGGLDAILDYGLDGRTIVFKRYDTATGVATTLLTCTMEQPTSDLTDMVIRLKDPQMALDVNVQPIKYLGNNAAPLGVEGANDLAGTPKPLTFGAVKNITPRLVNGSKLIYQVHSIQDTPTQLMNNIQYNFSYLGNWVLGGGWALTGGARCSGTNCNTEITQILTGIVVGDTYEFQIYVNNYVAGTLSVAMGDTGTFVPVTGIAATTLFYVRAVAAGTVMKMRILAGGTFNGSINYVMVKRVITADVPGVYDMGVPLPSEAEYTTISDMMANEPSPGKFRVLATGGYFRLGSTPGAATPAGVLTCDVVEGANITNRTAAQIALRVAKQGLALSAISVSTFTSLGLTCPSECGIYISADATINSVLDDVLGGVGSWHGFDTAGLLTVGQLVNPSGGAALSLTNVEIIGLNTQVSSDQGNGLPIASAKLNYSKNYTVLGPADLAGVFSSSVDAYFMRWDVAAAPLGSISAAYGNGLLVVVDGYSVAVSSDTVNWTKTLGIIVSSVVFGAGIFLAVSTTLGSSYTSSDGVNWTLRTTFPLFAPNTFETLTWCPEAGKFIALPRDTFNAPYLGYTSVDGINWVSFNFGAQYVVVEGVAYTGGKWIFSMNDLAVTSSIYTSTDLITFTPRFAYGTFNTGVIAVGNSGRVVVLQYGGNLIYHAVVSTDGGITWTSYLVPSATWQGTTMYWQYLVFVNGRFIATGYYSSMVSTDGINWQVLPMPVYSSWSWLVSTGSYAMAGTAGYSADSVVIASLGKSPAGAWYGKEYRSTLSTDPTVKTKHLLALAQESNSLINSPVAAQIESDRQLALRKVRRDFLIVDVKISSITAIPKFGQIVKITYNRFGYNAGKLFLFLGFDMSLNTNDITLYLWG